MTNRNIRKTVAIVAKIISMNECTGSSILNCPCLEVEICPSSGDLRPIRRFEKGGSGSSGLEFKRPAADAASGGLRWLYA
jgi:hypothetical protein